jgi:hypothetical protein
MDTQINRAQRLTKLLNSNFNYISGLMTDPEYRPTFAELTTAVVACKRTHFSSILNSELEYQSFTVNDTVLLRLTADSPLAVWLDLEALPCSKKNAKLVRELFEQCWIDKAPVPLETLAALVPFSKLKADDGDAWRDVMRSHYYDDVHLAADVLDRICQMPKRHNDLQTELEDLLTLADNIRPTSQLTESNYVGSKRAVDKITTTEQPVPPTTRQSRTATTQRL